MTNAFQMVRPRGDVLGPDPTSKHKGKGATINARGRVQAQVNPDAPRGPRDVPTRAQWCASVDKQRAMTKAKL